MKGEPECLSVQIIEEYYRNDPTLFFDNVDDDFIWVDPTINQCIEGKGALLKAWANEHNTLTVRPTVLPQQTCFVRHYLCADTADAANKLRDTYIAAAHTGKMSTVRRMFTMRMWSDRKDGLDLMCCIPVEADFDRSERMEFAEINALCIYYRGPYEGTATAIRALTDYVRENNIEMTGPFRSIYLEGPPNRGEKSGDYITQVAVPVRG